MRSQRKNLKRVKGLGIALPLLLAMAAPVGARSHAVSHAAAASSLAHVRIAPSPPPSLLAGQVRNGQGAPGDWAGTSAVPLPDTPLDNPLLPEAPGRSPFDDPPPEAGVVSSRVGIAGKGLTLGVEMPF